MTELAQGRTGRTARIAAMGSATDVAVSPGVPAAVPSPACIRPRRVSVVPAGAGVPAEAGVPAAREERTAEEPESGRATARAALEAALHGMSLSDSDRRFLSRLSQWDKRNASAVASLMRRARQQGQDEAGLAPEQLEVVLAALTDAFAYRTSGAASAACWDCASRPTGVCVDHALDADRARSFASMLTALSGKVPPTPMTWRGAVPGFRRRRPVAS